MVGRLRAVVCAAPGAVACMVGALLFAVWYGSWIPVREQPVAAQPAPVRGIPVDEDLTKPREEDLKAEHALAVEAIYPRPDSLNDVIPVPKPKALVVRKAESKGDRRSEPASALRQEPSVTAPQEVPARTPEPATAKEPAPVATQPAGPAAQAGEPAPKEPQVTAGKEEKKRGFLKNLFRKKKREAAEEPAATTN